nr:alpha/beta hydrolase [Rhodococcus sp. (in: high G+C Gram-positive bacteria)]
MPTFATDDNVTLSYIDQGDGPVVLLIAGFCAPATSWALQQDELVDAGYRVLALDRRGHGDSEAPEFGATMARHGRDVENFLTSLGIDDAILCGGSMGASTIWSYISQFGTSCVRAVVSVDQTPKMINDGEWQNGFYGLTEANKDAFFADGIPDTGRGLSKAKMMLGGVKLLMKLRSMPKMAKGDTPPMKALLHDHAVSDWRKVVAEAEVPILMVAGRESQFWPFAHSIVDNPLAQSVVLDKCGHAANMDRPKEFNAALLGFLRSLPQ